MHRARLGKALSFQKGDRMWPLHPRAQDRCGFCPCVELVHHRQSLLLQHAQGIQCRGGACHLRHPMFPGGRRTLQNHTAQQHPMEVLHLDLDLSQAIRETTEFLKLAMGGIHRRRMIFQCEPTPALAEECMAAIPGQSAQCTVAILGQSAQCTEATVS